MDPTELMFDPSTEPAPPPAHEAELILPNMRGACVTVGGRVHMLFRLGTRSRSASTPDERSDIPG